MRRAGQPNAARQEDGLWVSLAEGAEVNEEAIELGAGLGHRQLVIDPQPGLQIRAPQPLAGHRVERLPEAGDPVGANLEPGRRAMSAILLEVRLAGLQGVVQVKARNRAARTAPAIAVQRDEHRRTVELLDDA